MVAGFFWEKAMTMKLKLRMAMFPVFVAAAFAWGSAGADEVPLINGQHWTQSTEQLKKAYLIGLANVMQVDTAYQAGNAPSDAQSVIPRFARGLKGQTLDSVREGLDRWYAANPDKLQRPVIETIWFEMAAPGLPKTK